MVIVQKAIFSTGFIIGIHDTVLMEPRIGAHADFIEYYCLNVKQTRDLPKALIIIIITMRFG